MGGRWFRSDWVEIEVREALFMAQATDPHRNEGHREVTLACRALAVAIVLSLPANNLAAAAGRPPSKDYFSELGPEIHAALSKSGAKGGFTSRQLVLRESSRAADSIMRDPFNAPNIAAQLSDLNKYEALCGANVPTEVTQFRKDARALQVFVQSRQAATYQQSSTASNGSNFEVGARGQVKGQANPLTANATGEGSAGIGYGKSSEDKTEASGTVTIPQMNSADRTAYETLLRRLDTSKGLVDKAYREAETKQFEVQKAINDLPPEVKEIFDKLPLEEQVRVIDGSLETGQLLDEHLIITTYARKYVADCGKKGVSDYKEAGKWFAVAAADGDTSAQLGLAYSYALPGVIVGLFEDQKAAIHWIKQATPKESVAKTFSSIGYEWSALNGVWPSALVKAYMWFSLAVEMGDRSEALLKAMEEVEKKLSRDQLAIAKAEAFDLLNTAKD